MGWLSKLFNLDPVVEQKNIEEKKPSITKAKDKSGNPFQEASKNDACNRLKLVLMHDRTKLSSETIDKMRKEMIEVISKYVEIDEEALNLHFESEGNTIALAANVPVLKVRTPKEKATTTSEEKKVAVGAEKS